MPFHPSSVQRPGVSPSHLQRVKKPPALSTGFPLGKQKTTERNGSSGRRAGFHRSPRPVRLPPLLPTVSGHRRAGNAFRRPVQTLVAETIPFVNGPEIPQDFKPAQSFPGAERFVEDFSAPAIYAGSRRTARGSAQSTRRRPRAGLDRAGRCPASLPKAPRPPRGLKTRPLRPRSKGCCR